MAREDLLEVRATFAPKADALHQVYYAASRRLPASQAWKNRASPKKPSVRKIEWAARSPGADRKKTVKTVDSLICASLFRTARSLRDQHHLSPAVRLPAPRIASCLPSSYRRPVNRSDILSRKLASQRPAA